MSSPLQSGEGSANTTMVITWFGQACFKIEGEKTTIVTDPFGDDFGLKLSRLTADIVTVSHGHADHNNVAAVKPTGERALYIADTPGEFEVQGAFLYGIPSFHDSAQGAERGSNIIFRIELDGISIGHLGDLGHPLESAQLERLEGVDILMIPVGGVFTINGKQATEAVSQIEPRLVIPMHYQLPALKLSGGKKLDGLDPFCNEIGICPKEILPKLKITKKDLPQDNLQVVLLEA